MRKIKMFNMLSVDGYFTGEDGNIDWHTVDDEFNEFAIELMDGLDTIIFGRVTYQLFESYWPAEAKDPDISPEDKKIAGNIESFRKIVFSKTLTEVTWNGAELHADIDAAEVKEWKAQDGKDMVIYGSGTIVRQLTNLGLIDEYHIMVSPVILGTGKPLFSDLDLSLKLHLIDSRKFAGTGNVLLSYQTK